MWNGAGVTEVFGAYGLRLRFKKELVFKTSKIISECVSLSSWFHGFFF
jgi:hypothetical protein